MSARFDDPVTFNGAAKFTGGVVLPANCIGDNQFAAASPLSVDKQSHQYLERLTQAHGSAAVAERRVIHVAKSGGVVEDFSAGVATACVGDSTIDVDLKKNGTTILTGTIEIDSGDAAFDLVEGDLSSTSYSAGDVFEVVVAVTAGTGTLGQGLFAQAVFREAA